MPPVDEVWEFLGEEQARGRPLWPTPNSEECSGLHNRHLWSATPTYPLPPARTHIPGSANGPGGEPVNEFA